MITEIEHREGRCYNHSQKRDQRNREVLCVYKKGTVRIRGGIHIWTSITTMKIVKDVCKMEPR